MQDFLHKGTSLEVGGIQNKDAQINHEWLITQQYFMLISGVGLETASWDVGEPGQMK